MNTCIFCAIVKGKIPSYKIYEDNNYFGFLDINPRVKGHCLLIPKVHYQWVYDVPNFGAFWETALIVTKALQKTFNPSFISYVTHGLEIPHAHIHILPRVKGETMFVPEIKQFTKEIFEETARQIRKALPIQ